ncbi:hypothetical protein ACKU27_13855 [Sphingobium yanoikuyae]|uniref:hypothetical protein n=1 Tax=Sphingobium yanoikuyae TaxID=13690 RepID=UPI003B91B13C
MLDMGIPISALGEISMSGLSLAHRLALSAIVNGLRKGGEISDRSVKAIAEELRAATKVSDDFGHKDTSESLRHIAAAIEQGESGK